jgi:hypothetical protein
MADNENAASWEDRVERNAIELDDLKMLLRNITQLCSSDRERILGADAIDSIARSIERIEEDLWALKNDMETVTMAQRAAARAA